MVSFFLCSFVQCSQTTFVRGTMKKARIAELKPRKAESKNAVEQLRTQELVQAAARAFGHAKAKPVAGHPSLVAVLSDALQKFSLPLVNIVHAYLVYRPLPLEPRRPRSFRSPCRSSPGQRDIIDTVTMAFWASRAALSITPSGSPSAPKCGGSAPRASFLASQRKKSVWSRKALHSLTMVKRLS